MEVCTSDLRVEFGLTTAEADKHLALAKKYLPTKSKMGRFTLSGRDYVMQVQYVDVDEAIKLYKSKGKDYALLEDFKRRKQDGRT